jgi:chemotaxis protein MotC
MIAIATGSAFDRAALDAKRDAVNDEFLSVTWDVEVRKDVRNARALAVFVLVGGEFKAEFAEILSSMSSLPEQLVKGLIALGNANRREALDQLKKLGVLGLPPQISGAAALTAARLYDVEDDAVYNKGRLLDLARLLAPGTLIEEYALRLQISLAVESGDVDRFVTFSRRFVWRFGKTIYFAEFAEQFSRNATKLWIASTDVKRLTLEESFAFVPKDVGQEAMLLIAREALLSGDMDGCRSIVRRIEATGDASASNAVRLRLYKAVVGAFSPDGKGAVDDLIAIDSDSLEESDRAMREAALVLGRSISMARADDFVGGVERAETSALRKIEASLSRASVILGDKR